MRALVTLISSIGLAMAQSPMTRSASMEPVAGPSMPSISSMPSLNVQGAVTGSIPTGDLSQNLDLSLRDALNRALKYNLALVIGNENTALARAQRLQALSQLLPAINARPTFTEQQVNLAAFGLSLPGVPSVVGPFHVWDFRAVGTENLSFSGLRNYQASRLSSKAADLTLKDARDQVAQVVVQLYLQAIAGAARIDAARAQVATAQTLYKQAADRKNAGTVPAIDVLRAQVELQGQQQRLIYYEGEFEKQKLTLARAIGLPAGQSFRLADTVPYVPLPSNVELQDALEVAYRTRSDLQAAEAQVKSAELSVGAARGQRLPSAFVNADYGVNGLHLDQLHGSFTVATGVNVPIFESGRIRAGVEQASAALRERRAQRDDLKGRIDADVRNAYIDLRSAARQVEVARSNVDLAQQQVTQSQDRFNAGVTNNVEVVQAQDALATANENYIAALYAFNAAKVALGRARGDADESILQSLNVK